MNEEKGGLLGLAGRPFFHPCGLPYPSFGPLKPSFLDLHRFLEALRVREHVHVREYVRDVLVHGALG